jgi:hypothetical protein
MRAERSLCDATVNAVIGHGCACWLLVLSIPHPGGSSVRK